MLLHDYDVTIATRGLAFTDRSSQRGEGNEGWR